MRTAAAHRRRPPLDEGIIAIRGVLRQKILEQDIPAATATRLRSSSTNWPASVTSRHSAYNANSRAPDGAAGRA